MARRLDQERCTLCNTRMLGLEACPRCGTAIRCERPSSNALSAIVASSSADKIDFAADLEERPVPVGRPIAAPFVNAAPRGSRTTAHLEAVFSTQDLPVLEPLVAPSRLNRTSLFGALAATVVFASATWLLTSGALGPVPESTVGQAQLGATKQTAQKILVAAPDDRETHVSPDICDWDRTERVRRRGNQVTFGAGGQIDIIAKDAGGQLTITSPQGEVSEVDLALRPRFLRQWSSPDGKQALVLVESFDESTVRARLLSIDTGTVNEAVMEASIRGDVREQSGALGCTLMREHQQLTSVKLASKAR